jgi:RNA polymerase sigma factor (sigma-70 family)
MNEHETKLFEQGREKWFPYMSSLAFRFQNNVSSKEDLMQEGYVALINAAQSYDPDRDATFETWSFACIRNGIIKASVATCSPTSAPGGSGRILDYNSLKQRTDDMDTIEVPNDEWWIEFQDLVQAFDVEGIGYLHFVEKYTRQEIATMMNKSRATVSRAIAKMQKDIKKELSL